VFLKPRCFLNPGLYGGNIIYFITIFIIPINNCCSSVSEARLQILTELWDSLNLNGTKLCVITDIFGTTYFLTGTPVTWLGNPFGIRGIPQLIQFRTFELWNFHRNSIFPIIKCVPANSEHVFSGSESSPAINSSNFMNRKTFPLYFSLA
jgi:hypothetical protein